MNYVAFSLGVVTALACIVILEEIERERRGG